MLCISDHIDSKAHIHQKDMSLITKHVNDSSIFSVHLQLHYNNVIEDILFCNKTHSEGYFKTFKHHVSLRQRFQRIALHIWEGLKILTSQ